MSEPKKGARKKGGRPRVERPRRQIFTVRGTEEWRDWVLGLAEHCRMPASSVIDNALIRYAREMGYQPEPPKR